MRESLVWFWKGKKKTEQDNYSLTITPRIFTFLPILHSLRKRVPVLNDNSLSRGECEIIVCFVCWIPPKFFFFFFTKNEVPFRLKGLFGWPESTVNFDFERKLDPDRVIWFQGFDFLLLLFGQGNGSTICSFWFEFSIFF